MLTKRLLKQVTPVGKGAGELLTRLLASRIPEDPVFSGGIPASGTKGTLYLALDDHAFEQLQMRGIPCACVLPEKGDPPDFSGAKVLVSAPWDIDADSFERIYRRLYHLPWIIQETPRLYLREMMLQDLPALYACYDEEARRYLPPLSEDRDEEKKILAAYIEKVYGLAGYGYWAVIEKKTLELVGRAGFGVPKSSEDPAELGYLIRKDLRGQGYAKEAVQAALAYEKRVLKFPGVSAKTARDNLPSRRLLLSLGFSELPEGEDGICRYALFQNPAAVE
ncbi:MAG: GNAT family N-acetyltransferase [Lachnospiraceae bacterium]